MSTIPFRYPFLFEGFDPLVRAEIRAVLEQLGSPIAPVTIDTWDWLYARGWVEALAAGDGEAAQRHEVAWFWNLQEATLEAEHLANALFGREPPQILLVHANALTTEHIEQYLDWLQARGYTFVSLEQALDDPAYHELDHSWSPTGESHWLRLRRSRSLVKGAAFPNLLE